MQCKYFDQCDMKELPDDEIPDCIFNNGEGICTIDYDINMELPWRKEVKA